MRVLVLLQCWERTYGQLILPDREPAMCVSVCDQSKAVWPEHTAGCIWAGMRASTGHTGAGQWRGRRSCRHC